MKKNDEPLAEAAEKILTNIWPPIIMTVFSLCPFVALFFITEKTFVFALPLTFCTFALALLAWVMWIVRASVLRVIKEEESREKKDNVL